MGKGNHSSSSEYCGSSLNEILADIHHKINLRETLQRHSSSATELQLFKVHSDYSANLDNRRFSAIAAEDSGPVWIKRENM